MKILSTLGYLLVLGWKASLAKSQQATVLNYATGKSVNAALSYTVGIVILFLGFVQFWLLTRRFPFTLFLVLAGTVVVASMIQAIIGAIAGFSVGAKKQKVGVLTSIWILQHMGAGCALALTAAVLVSFSLLASLWVFWTHPLGEPKAVGWIAFYEFVLPQFVLCPSLFLAVAPMVSSEFVDNDSRNSQLSTAFSQAVIMAVTLVYPVTLFRDEFAASIGFIPDFWTLLSLPFAIFILGGVLPYFLGSRKYQTQSDTLLDWRREWLNEVLPIVNLPEGRDRSAGLDEMIERLDHEIQERVNENKSFELFEKLLSGESANVPTNQPVIDVQVVQDAGHVVDGNAAPAVSSNTPPAANENSPPSTAVAITDLNAGFFGKLSSYAPAKYIGAPNGTDNPLERVNDLIRANRDNLKGWDISFAHVAELLRLREVALSGKTQDVSTFIKLHLAKLDQNLKTVSQERPAFWGVLWACLSSVTPVLLKIFEPEVKKFILDLASSRGA